jgi:hypothetical protein
MGMARPEVSRHLQRGFRPLVGAEVGLLLNPWAIYKTAVVATQYWDPTWRSDDKQIFSVRWENSFFIARNFEIRQTNRFAMSSVRAGPDAEYRLATVLFYK